MTSRPKSTKPIVTYSEDNVEEKSWNLFLKDSLPGGLVHKAALKNMAAAFFESGHGVWRPLRCEDTEVFFVAEVFFIREKIRLSITMSYKEDDLIRVVSIREDWQLARHFRHSLS